MGCSITELCPSMEMFTYHSMTKELGFDSWYGLTFISSPVSRPALGPNHLSKEYQGLLPQGQSGSSMKLTTHPHVVLRFRLHKATSPLSHSTSWHGVYLSTGTGITFMFVYLPHSIRVHIGDSCQDGTANLREVCHIWGVRCHFIECVTAINMVCTKLCNQL
jgi:hypothetical protein